MMELLRDALQTLWEEGEFILSRGRRAGDRSPLLVLAPAVDQPAPGSLQRLAHEYALRDARIRYVRDDTHRSTSRLPTSPPRDQRTRPRPFCERPLFV